jgi:hypothetical protein
MIKKSKVETFVVRQICDYCKTGEMEYSHYTKLINYREKYPHTCNKCGNKELYNLKYPYITHVSDKVDFDGFGSPSEYVQAIGNHE